MKYANGYFELDDEELSAWELAFFRRIERYQEANEFISELMELQIELRNEMQAILNLNDRSVREESEAAIFETAGRMAKVYEELAKEAMAKEGENIHVH
jgi:hypothetical protein